MREARRAITPCAQRFTFHVSRLTFTFYALRFTPYVLRSHFTKGVPRGYNRTHPPHHDSTLISVRRTWEGIAVIFASKIAVIGLIIVLFWVFVAIFAPLLTPYSPTDQDATAQNQGPSAVHPLGTDSLGRDLWSRLIYGARVVLVILPSSAPPWV